MADDPVVTTPVAEAPVETAAPAVAEAPVAETSTTEAESETFSREYVEGLRKESAGYRTRAKELESVFEGLQDEDRGFFNDLISSYKTDPYAAAQQMSTVAQAVLAQRAEEGNNNDASDEPITRAEVEQILTQREAAAAEAAQVAQVEQAAESLGYTKDSDDYAQLLTLALREPDGDINKAHAKLEAKKQAIIDAYLADKAKDAAKVPTAPVAGGAPSGEREVKTLSQAKAALSERLNARQIS